MTHTARGTSEEGFDAEWRTVVVGVTDGDLYRRVEVFDEPDLDAALARFDELHRQAPRLHNVASQVSDRFLAHFAARDWGAMAEMTADDFSSDDRRRVVGAGVQLGRDVDIDNMRAWADVGIASMTSHVIATRGDRLFLGRTRFFGPEQGPDTFHSEVLGLVEIDTENRVVARVVFDADELDAAIAELDARYLAGEASTHSHTWTLVTDAFVALNQRKIPATTSDWVNIDHRRLVPIGTGDLAAYLSVAWELSPQSYLYVAAVHRLSSLGAVITHVAAGTSPEGLDAEWQVIDVMTFEGDRINRCELFDESDLDTALARFDELHGQTRKLENAASRAEHRLFDRSSTHDWAAIAEILAPDSFVDDRRRVVNVGFWDGRDAVMAKMRALAEGLAQVSLTVIATRGKRLSLARVRSFNPDSRREGFAVELLGIAEIDTDGRIAAHVFFDADDIDAAFEELDARYLAGEAAAYAHTWSVTSRANAKFNRHELPATTPDPVYIDHRSLVSIEGVDLATSVGALWDLTSDTSAYIEAVHQLTEDGTVTTQVLKMTSQDGFDAELRLTYVIVVEGNLLSRVEVFEGSDLEVALAHFDQVTCRDQPK